MNRFPLRKLLITGAISSLLHLAPALAQTNERLMQERLISPEVNELLNRRGVTTREERMKVVQEACGTGELSESDCAPLGLSKRRYRSYPSPLRR